MPSFAPLVRIIVALGAITALSPTPAAAAEPRSSSPYTAVSIPLTRHNGKYYHNLTSRFEHHRIRGPYARASGGQPLGWESGVGVYTVEATIDGKSYHLIPSFGTPNVILAQSSNYTGGNKTGKALEETYGSPNNEKYPVDIILGEVKLSGMTAPGVGIGKARSDILIVKEATTKPVGILGLAPENEDAYVEQLPSAKALVTASGPTPFAFKLGDKTGTLIFQKEFSAQVWCPFSKRGDTWDAVGEVNGVTMEQGTLDIQEDRFAIDEASATKMLKNMGLTPVQVDYEGTKITTGKVDCEKGAPITIKGPNGGKGVTISGKESVQKIKGICYSLIQGYGGNQTFWVVPAQLMSQGAILDIKGRRVGFGGL